MANHGTPQEIFNLENEFLIILYFGGIYCGQLFFLIFIIHIEYNYGFILNFRLKDKYSHNLANMLQAILMTSDILEKKLLSTEEEGQFFDLLKEKCKEAAHLIKKIRKLKI